MLSVHLGFAAGAAEFFATDADIFNLQGEPRLDRRALKVRDSQPRQKA